MPSYDYQCNSCEAQFEAFQSIHDEPLTDCLHCSQAQLRRLIAGLIFKGFYINDSKKVGSKAQQAPRNMPKKSQAGGSDFRASFWGALGDRLRRLREQVEPVMELGLQQAAAQKVAVLLRGGRPRPFALVGASGTGKSFRALLFAENYNIPFLIDDGILIEGGRIVAGRSAKNEQIYIKAIKTALLDDPEHLAELRQAIRKNRVQRILLVGTSIKMVRLIAKRLGLPKIAESDITYIEEISSPKEIAQARKSRHTGHHIIPVPALEVSREYSSLMRKGRVFLSDLRMGMKHYLKKKGRNRGKKVFEKTLVKPHFMKKIDSSQQAGRIQITESALRQMIAHCIDEYSPDIRIERLRIGGLSCKVKVFIKIPLDMHGKELSGFLYKLQNYVLNSLQRYGGVVLEELNIEVLEFL